MIFILNSFPELKNYEAKMGDEEADLLTCGWWEAKWGESGGNRPRWRWRCEKKKTKTNEK